jgi:hypothetical protein
MHTKIIHIVLVISCAVPSYYFRIMWVRWVEPKPFHVVHGFNAHVGIIIPNLQPIYLVAKDTCYWVGKSIYPLINNKSLYVSTIQNLVYCGT